VLVVVASVGGVAVVLVEVVDVITVGHRRVTATVAVDVGVRLRLDVVVDEALVVVVVMLGVCVAVVQVVDVPVVRQADVAALLAVPMPVRLGGRVRPGVALVVVPVVRVVPMTVVQIVDVPDVLQRLVAAVDAMDVRVGRGVRVVLGVGRHGSTPRIMRPLQANCPTDEPGGRLIEAGRRGTCCLTCKRPLQSRSEVDEVEDLRRSGSIAGMLQFLDWCTRDAAFNQVTIQAMKSGVKSVASKLGLMPDEPVAELDVESTMDRFQRAMGPSFRSAATYRTRVRVATQLYLAWLDDDPDWKTVYRSRRSTAFAGNDSRELSPATRTVDFPVERGFSVRLELPHSLNRHTADRLHALIDSLVLEEGTDHRR